MPEQDIININEDLATILSKKRKYHEEQIEFHQGELQKLNTFGGSSNGKTDLWGEPINDKKRENFTKSWWWEKHIPAFVKVHFPNSEFKNADLIRVANIPGIEDDAYRKEVRYGISVALRSLVEKGGYTSRKEDGEKGYKYKKK